MYWRRISSVIVSASICLVCTPAADAQVPPPPPASPTIWSFLGIPQGMYKLHGHLVNRRGNHPRLEKKPPLKALADVANLKSEVPAIKAAAEIKQAEDLKPQKIKAIKFLATIGCGCYDKDGKVTKALLAAMEDCTEEVRLEAVRAVSVAASGEYCEHCKQRSCCNEELVTQLSKIANDRDDMGCFVEPSARVREAAAEAMGICCAGQGPPLIEETAPPQPVESVPEAAPVEGVERDEPPAPIAEPDSMTRRGTPGRSRLSPSGPQLTQLTSSRRNAASRIGAYSDSDYATVASSTQPEEVLSSEAIDQPGVPQEIDEATGPEVFKKVTGKVIRVNQNLGLVQLQLAENATLPNGVTVKVYHRVSGGAQLSAVLQIVSSQPGAATARLAGTSRVHKFSVGEAIEVWK